MKLASLTFDDGYLTQWRIARLLARLGIFATFFIPTGIKRLKGKPLMTEQPHLIKLLHGMGHEIGSHGVSHTILKGKSMTIVEEECIESKQYLEELLSCDIQGFAYPFGLFDDSVVNIVKKHYRYARGTVHNVDPHNFCTNDIFRIGGLGISPRTQIYIAKNSMRYLHEHLFLVVIFHDENTSQVLATVAFLRSLGMKFVRLSELVATMQDLKLLS
jgi:peptidoglycan/xylan/chitin deacetylase (PgdA/CDA1 family)